MTNDLRNRLNKIIDDHNLNIGHAQPYDLKDQSYFRVIDAIIAKLDPDALIVAALEVAADAADKERDDARLHSCNTQAVGAVWSAKAIRALAADPEARAAIKAKAGWSE